MGSNRCSCSQYAVIKPDGTVTTTQCRTDPVGARSLFTPGHDAKLKKLFVEAWFAGPDTLHELVAGSADRWVRTKGSPLDEAREFGWGLSVAKAIDQRSAKERADRIAGRHESRATRAVMRALQKPDGQRNSHDPIGATFGDDLSSYTGAAQAWLRDKTELSTRTIAGANYTTAFNWFIHGE